jgi:hypothetical protein
MWLPTVHVRYCDMTVFSVNSSSKKSHNICNISWHVHITWPAACMYIGDDQVYSISMVSGISLSMSNEDELEQYRTWTVGSHMTVFSVNSSSKKSHNICNISWHVHITWPAACMYILPSKVKPTCVINKKKSKFNRQFQLSTNFLSRQESRNISLKLKRAS